MQSRTGLRVAQRELRDLQGSIPDVIYPDYFRMWYQGIINEWVRAEDAFSDSLKQLNRLPRHVRDGFSGLHLSLCRIFINDQIMDKPSIEAPEHDYIGRFIMRLDPPAREWVEGKIAEGKSINEAHDLLSVEIPGDVQEWADWRTKQLGDNPSVRELPDLDLVAFTIGNY